jgi:glycosyltransferase involved in cell wall biosynthesis
MPDIAPDVTIVLPVYEEGDLIGTSLSQITERIGRAKEVLVVYDLDTDSTLPPARAFAANHPEVRLLKNRYGRGVLNAIKTGFDAAHSDRIAVVMADLSDDPAVVNAMLDAMDRGAHVICASRYMKGGGQDGGPFVKKALSRMAGLSLHVLTGIPTHDVTNNFRLYHRDALRVISIESARGFELALEITVKAYLEGFMIDEVPTVWRDRTAGESKFRLWRWLPAYLRWYGYALVRSPFRRKSR